MDKKEPRKNKKLTSITEAAATKHTREAEARKTLFCTKLTGFHLLKLSKNGGSWRYRYSDATGRLRVFTVGKFPAMLPEIAAERVSQWIVNNTDPLKEKAADRQEAISEVEGRKLKSLGYYFSETYSDAMKKERWPERSIKMNVNWMEKNFKHLFSIPMDEIGKTHIDRWAESEEERKIAHNTIKRVFTVLRAVISRALKDGVISETLLKDYKLPAPSFEEEQTTLHTEDRLKDKRRMLSQKEILRLHRGLDAFSEIIRQQRRNSRAHGKPHLQDLDAVAYPHWFEPFCLLALHTGLRPGDIYSLTWQELNISFNRLKKLTGKSRQAVRKGKRGTVVEMKMNATIHGIMKSWWEMNGKPETGLVFPSPVTGDMMTLTAHKRPWSSVRELGELSSDLDFYSLRHHFISRLIVQGYPLFTVAKMAGHKSIDMIQEHYGHLCEKQASEAVDVIGDDIDATLTLAAQ